MAVVAAASSSPPPQPPPPPASVATTVAAAAAHRHRRRRSLASPKPAELPSTEEFAKSPPQCPPPLPSCAAPRIAGDRRTVGDLELAVEREQQRQPARPDRIDILVLAAVPPDAPQALIALAIFAEHHGRGVMQEAAERAAAEASYSRV